MFFEGQGRGFSPGTIPDRRTSLNCWGAMDRARIEKISKALADQTRLMIFEAISTRKEMNCGEIVALRGVTPATVSHHLKILSDSGLIQCRRHGQFVHNTVVPKALAEYTQALTRLAQGKKPSKP